MTWEMALQSLFVAGSSIGAWFMYDLVKEFKDFKKETVRELSQIRLCVEKANTKVEEFENFMIKSARNHRQLNKRQRALEQRLKLMRNSSL